MSRRLHLTTLALLAAGAAGCGDRADPGPTEPGATGTGARLPAAASRQRAAPRARRPARHRSGSRAGWRWPSRSPASAPTSRTRSTARPCASTSFTSSTSSAAPAAGPAAALAKGAGERSPPSIPTRARPSRSRCTCPCRPIARPGAAARTSWWPPHGTTTRPRWPTTRGAVGGCSTRARLRPRRCSPSCRWRPTSAATASA